MTSRRPHPRAPRLAWAMLPAVLVSACAATGQLTYIDPADVPSDLKTAPSATATPTVTESSKQPIARAYWATGQNSLIGRPVESSEQDTRAVLEDVLAQLEQGPGPEAQATGVRTLLPEGSQLTVLSVAAGLAEINLEMQNAPASDRQPQLIAQIVLTATSVRFDPANPVNSVRLRVNDESSDLPLLDGRLVQRPLTADDYAGAVVTVPIPSSQTGSTDEAALPTL